MNNIELQRIRDDKINKMMQGQSVHIETTEMMRLLKRAIKRNALDVHIDHTRNGTWVMLRSNS